MKYTAGSVGVRFSYAGAAPIQEADPFGTVLRRYVPGPSVDETVVAYEGSGTANRRWLHTDERGSVIAISDGSGAMLSINRYDEYGIPAATNAGRFQYTGQMWLPELGMYSYKARIYTPTLGRFMQTDPIGYGDGLNWYNYVGGDPLNGTDPSGMTVIGCTGSRVCGYVHRDGSGGTYTTGGPLGMVSSANGPSQGRRGESGTTTRLTFTTYWPDGTTTSSSFTTFLPNLGPSGASFANPISSAGAGAMPGDIVVRATTPSRNQSNGYSPTTAQVIQCGSVLIVSSTIVGSELVETGMALWRGEAIGSILMGMVRGTLGRGLGRATTRAAGVTVVVVGLDYAINNGRLTRTAGGLVCPNVR